MEAIRHLFLVSMCAAALTGCDPLSYLDEGDRAGRRTFGKQGLIDRWTCADIVAPNRYVCRAGVQAVTVTLLHVAVPGALSAEGKRRLLDATSLPEDRLPAFAAQAGDMVSNLLCGRTVALRPEPSTDVTMCGAVVHLSTKDDVGARLLREGLAVVVTSAMSRVPEMYAVHQQRAMNLDLGLWQPLAGLSNRFVIDASVSLTPVYEARRKRHAVGKLPRFHSPDLYRGPALMPGGMESPEPTAVVMMQCAADITVDVKGPPKQYELSISFRPCVRANEMSGPLSSFKELSMAWDEETLVVDGGSEYATKIQYESLELTRVLRGDDIGVYSGYVTIGYELEVTVDGDVVYAIAGDFREGATLDELNATSTGLF